MFGPTSNIPCNPSLSYISYRSNGRRRIAHIIAFHRVSLQDQTADWALVRAIASQHTRRLDWFGWRERFGRHQKDAEVKVWRRATIVREYGENGENIVLVASRFEYNTSKWYKK
ncbi:hypothetical protein PEX2_105700 [Penicillium expansum]|uniref:Uncharacterized protein n=1 Tax=Penicillium expansum TaxID=27334 RepID=A0A0A2I5N8_PENEN|nr:hypothetical protein PEX2_105700 [Penicillium expansum]KGO37713.1 hypothetical protein PEXP_077290 [Penicillium expansum]KGO49936.1 hypothetical protein PEX2_105700 [Penicillium expansum]